jgi:hypothetical protein
MTNSITRTCAVIASIVAAGLLASACGSGPQHANASGDQNGGTSAYYQKALAFSKCMRSNGDPSWPDPGPQGAFPNVNGSLDKSSPRFKAASKACAKLSPGGAPQSVFQADYRKLLRYSACMRAHGDPSFPDPVLDAHGDGYTGRMDTNSPQYQRANSVCHSLFPGRQ